MPIARGIIEVHTIECRASFAVPSLCASKRDSGAATQNRPLMVHLRIIILSHLLIFGGSVATGPPGSKFPDAFHAASKSMKIY